MDEVKDIFGTVDKCAIFVHYSINDEVRIEEKRKKLEKFCKETLKCDNYEVFIEIGSFESERTVFNEMLKRFEEKEFSHLLVVDIGQIYKLSYDMEKAIEITDKIQNMNVITISVDENRIIEGIDRANEIRAKMREEFEVKKDY